MAPPSKAGSTSNSAASQLKRRRAASTGALGKSDAARASPAGSRGGRSTSGSIRGTDSEAVAGAVASSSPPAAEETKAEEAARHRADALRGPDGKVAGVDGPGPGDHTNGYRGAWPHFKATYWDLGRKSTYDAPMAHRPPSEYGSPNRHNHMSQPLFHPRGFAGTKSHLQTDDVGRPQECHKTFRQPLPGDPTKTMRAAPGDFGAGGSTLKIGSLRVPVRIQIAETHGQTLPKTPPIALEGDNTKGFKGTEPHFASIQSQYGRVGFIQEEWGVPAKHHFNSNTNCYPDLVHKSKVPNKPLKQEGDMSRGFEGPRPHMWTTHWEYGHDTSFKHTRKRYDFTPLAEANFRFAMAREGFPGSSA